MKVGDTPLLRFSGLDRRLARLYNKEDSKEGDVNYREDQNGRRYRLGVWEGRLGLSRPETHIPDDATDIVGIGALLGVHDLSERVLLVQESGKLVEGVTPLPEWK